MSSPELLSRTGCTILDGKRSGSLVMLTSSHVAAPFRWPQYYGDVPWLHHVRQDCVTYALELRDLQGEVVDTAPLPASVVHHESRDICVMGLPEDLPFLEHLEPLVRQDLSQDAASQGAEKVYYIHGFEVGEMAGEDEEKTSKSEEAAAAAAEERTGQGSVSTEDDRRPLKPLNVEARFVAAKGDTIYARPAMELPFGMCGSPMVDADGKVAGVVEGVIQGPAANAQITEEQRQALEKMKGLAQLISFAEGLQLVERANL